MDSSTVILAAALAFLAVGAMETLIGAGLAANWRDARRASAASAHPDETPARRAAR